MVLYPPLCSKGTPEWWKKAVQPCGVGGGLSVSQLSSSAGFLGSADALVLMWMPPPTGILCQQQTLFHPAVWGPHSAGPSSQLQASFRPRSPCPPGAGDNNTLWLSLHQAVACESEPHHLFVFALIPHLSRFLRPCPRMQGTKFYGVKSWFLYPPPWPATARSKLELE